MQGLSIYTDTPQRTCGGVSIHCYLKLKAILTAVCATGHGGTGFLCGQTETAPGTILRMCV